MSLVAARQFILGKNRATFVGGRQFLARNSGSAKSRRGRGGSYFERTSMIFPEALKKRGVGMVVGAPSRCTRYTHASDGSAWSSGERGSVAQARFEFKQAGTVNSNPNGC